MRLQLGWFFGLSLLGVLVLVGGLVMKINFVTLCSGEYWMGFAALVESIAQNSELDVASYRFSVYTNRAVDSEVLSWIASRRERIDVLESSDLDLIEVRHPQEQPHLAEALKKVVLIGESVEDADERQVMIDSDMLCLGSLAGIEDLPSFAAAPDALYGFVAQVEPSDQPVDVNTGFVTFVPSVELRDALIAMYNAGPELYCKAADQDLFNALNRERGFMELIGSEWNGLKSVLRDKGRDERAALLGQMRLLHIITEKPWSRVGKVGPYYRQKSLLEVEQLWWRYYSDAGLRDRQGYPLRAQLHPYLRFGLSFVRAKWRKLSRR